VSISIDKEDYQEKTIRGEKEKKVYYLILKPKAKQGEGGKRNLEAR
jgi:hypothetical protein